MKKIALITTALVTVLCLSACSQKSANKSSNSNHNSPMTKPSKTAPTAINKSIAKELEDKFNRDDEKNVNVSIETDVADEQSVTDKHGKMQGHQIIKVTIVDPQALKTMKAAKAALDSNSADETQTQSIAGIQMVIADAAQKLSNDYDTISVGWPLEDTAHTQLIALATRKKNIIAIAGQQ